MKKMLFVSCLCLSASLAFAAPVVAVVDFDSGIFCTEPQALVMSDAFRNEMVRSGRMDVVTRTHLEALKNEMRFQMSAWADPSKIKQAGRRRGASRRRSYPRVLCAPVRNF